MVVKKKRGWEIPEREATPESVFLNRRNLTKGIAAGAILAAGGAAFALRGRNGEPAALEVAETTGASVADLYPAQRNPRYVLDRDVTPEVDATTFNNFFEFGSHKRIASAAQEMVIEPWTVEITGMVEQPRTVGFDDLVRQMPLEERLYRHRCVEAWAMAVPWTGFPMKALIDFAAPTGDAKYVVMQTAMQEESMPGLRQFWYPWPYIEGLTMAEATHELAFMVTGMYGKPAPKQNGAPLRLAVPWKYGFKSVKSIVRFEFTDQRPVSYWERIAGTEYGFWANVNPEVPHPRWSQAEERLLGSNEMVPTQIFNGYGEFVADLYNGLPPDEPIFM